MFVQVALQGESLSTALANVRLAAGVCLYMSSKVRLICKSFAANRARKRLFTCMSAYVPLQQPWAAETLPAVRALTALAVCPHVHAVSGHRDVHLFTVRTLSGLLVRYTTMGLTMPCKVAGRAIPLPAFTADVIVLLAVAEVR